MTLPNLFEQNTGNIEAHILTSRTMQEQIECTSQNSIYGVFSMLIYNNIDKIDRFSEFASEGIALGTMGLVDSLQYKKKNHKVKSFVERNIYVNPLTRQQYQLGRTLAGHVVGKAAEVALKTGSRVVYEGLKNKNELDLYTKIYQLLRFYALSDSDKSNDGKGMLEVKKILNSFPITDAAKKKILDTAKNSTKELNTFSIDESQKEALSYFLYSIYCQKCFGYPQYTTDGLYELYRFLDFGSEESLELLNENKNKYQIITREQTQYLKLSRRFVTQLSLGIPDYNKSQVSKNIHIMAQFDPYDIRRKVVRKAGAGSAITIAGIYTKNPQLVLNGLSTALSIINFDDDKRESTRERLRDYGMDEYAIERAFHMGQDITSNSSIMVDVY